MRVTEVTFGFTKNLGNYQSARAEAKVQLSEEDDPFVAMAVARVLVKEELELPLDPTEKPISEMIRKGEFQV